MIRSRERYIDNIVRLGVQCILEKCPPFNVQRYVYSSDCGLIDCLFLNFRAKTATNARHNTDFERGSMKVFRANLLKKPFGKEDLQKNLNARRSYLKLRRTKNYLANIIVAEVARPARLETPPHNPEIFQPFSVNLNEHEWPALPSVYQVMTAVILLRLDASCSSKDNQTT